MNELSNGRVRWVVVRLGAYMHYAVPRMLHRAGLLERFYTDFYAGSAWTRLLSCIPKRWRSAAIERATGRKAADLPSKLVHSYPLLGIEYYVRRALAKGHASKSRVFLATGMKFGRLVSRDGFGKAGGVYTFTTAALEVLKAAKQQGLVTVLEQTIAPRAIEEELLAEEQQRFPGWEPVRISCVETEETIERERKEWALADLIICGSEFVRQGIARCGGPLQRCVVVPYGVDVEIFSALQSPASWAAANIKHRGGGSPERSSIRL